MKFAGMGVINSGECRRLPGWRKNPDCRPFRMTTALEHNVIFKAIIPGSCDRPIEDLNVPLTPV